MVNELRRLGYLVLALVVAFGCLIPTARALDTPNVLMTIDGMTMTSIGLFRNNSSSTTAVDGYNTFNFGPAPAAGGALGRYKSFYLVTTGTGDKGISHNARFHSDTPEVWGGASYAGVEDVDLDNDYYPFVDRAAGGQLFDPSEYQIEVKFKPNAGVSGLPDNTAPFFNVGLDQVDGYVFDADTGIYKRANDAFTYNIGSVATPINTYYASAPKDADGFATWTVPVTSPNNIQRGYYYFFGDGPKRDTQVVTGGGRAAGADVNDGLDTLSFGGGAVDPNPAHVQLKAPNGVPLISLGAPAAETGLSMQFKYVTLKKITPGPVMARIDSNSGITFRFGTALTYGATQPAIPGPDGSLQPNATGQISRFDQNGMTNMVVNARTPDAGDTGAFGYQYRFVNRVGPSAESFDGTQATFNIRAKLTESLANAGVAQNMTIIAKDLDGSDNGAQKGADEYTKSIALSQFNTSTFTTVSIPLSSFDLATFVATTFSGTSPVTAGSGPFGFANSGDGLKTNFDLYEFGAGVPVGGGLLRLEIEFMEIRLNAAGVPGDYNGNGIVDTGDFTIYRDHLGQAFQLPNEVSGVTPGQVTIEDYNAWKARFGNISGSGSAVPAPEPATWLLMSLAAAFVGFARRRIK